MVNWWTSIAQQKNALNLSGTHRKHGEYLLRCKVRDTKYNKGCSGLPTEALLQI